MRQNRNRFNGPAYSQEEVRQFGSHVESHLEYWATDGPCPGLGRKIKRRQSEDGLWDYPKADVDAILAYPRPAEQFIDLVGVQWVETDTAAGLLGYNPLTLHNWKRSGCPWGDSPESKEVLTYDPNNVRGFIKLTYWKRGDLKRVVDRREAQKSRCEGRISVEEARRRLGAKSCSSVFRITRLKQKCLADQEHPDGRIVDHEVVNRLHRKGGKNFIVRKLLLSEQDINAIKRHRDSLRNDLDHKRRAAGKRRKRAVQFPEGVDLTTAEATTFLGLKDKSLLFYWHYGDPKRPEGEEPQCPYLPGRRPLRKGTPRQGLIGSPSDTWNREDLEIIRRNRGTRFDGKPIIEGRLYRTARNAGEEYRLFFNAASLDRWERNGSCPYLPDRRAIDTKKYTPVQRGRIPGKAVTVFPDDELQLIKVEIEKRRRLRDAQPQDEIDGRQIVSQYAQVGQAPPEPEAGALDRTSIPPAEIATPQQQPKSEEEPRREPKSRGGRPRDPRTAEIQEFCYNEYITKVRTAPAVLYDAKRTFGEDAPSSDRAVGVNAERWAERFNPPLTLVRVRNT
jgi:hypothetical protein